MGGELRIVRRPMKTKLESLYEDNKVIFGIGAIIATIIVWSFSTFATAKEVSGIKKDVTSQKIEVLKYVDDRHAEVRSDLQEIKQNQKDQGDRLFTILSEIRKR